MDEEPRKDDRVPRGAIAVVLVGLVATLGVLAIDFVGGGTSAELDWTTTEQIDTLPGARVGPGEMSMDRTTLSAIGQNGAGEALFRVSGLLRVDSKGERVPTQARCEIVVLDPESQIARTPNGKAAWPRPSNDLDLQKQDVPESSIVGFNAVGNDILGLPIRDAINRYTNSAVRTTADWKAYQERVQSWVWDMPKGTGPSAALLGYVVIFKTSERPEARLECEATIDGTTVTQIAMARQSEWPLPEPTLNPETEASSTGNVE